MHNVYLPRPLPDSLASMIDLALDLRWSCTRAADRFWRQVDQEAWDLSASPWLVLQNLSDKRLQELAANRDFLDELGRANDFRDRALDGEKWFASNGAKDVNGIAYFSMEFGLSEALPLYSGGLGILAGDYLKSAGDIGLPVTGVGLLYQQGYFRQALSADGWQQEIYPFNNPMELPVQPVVTENGWLQVEVELPGRVLRVRVWKATVGNIPLYLLDSDNPMNSPYDCGITGVLYGGNKEMRIQQEVVLGIGGWRALEALGIQPEVCHLNEGHAAFAVLERARSFAARNRASFWEGLWATRPGNVFTTHTAVEAGFDKFDPELARRYLAPFCDAMGPAAPYLEDILALGRHEGWNGSEPLNMAYLAMRGCGWANGVSELHGQVSRALFRPIFARWPEADVPVGSVTNGVHIPSWVSERAEHLWDDHGVEHVQDEQLWEIRNAERERLVHFCRVRLARQLAQRGRSKDEVRVAEEILDPEILTLGFARRFAAYKRPNLLLRDSARLRNLLMNQDRPVQLIIAGKAHPADDGGKRLIQNWVRWIGESGVRNRVVFLEDYDMELTQNLAAGVDVWINTPRRPWEASGTSGMKLLANGGMNLSELDGWWAEAYSEQVGWAIGDGQVHEPEGSEDDAEAGELYSLLERQVAPKFYDRDQGGIPRAWLKQMRASMEGLTARFSSNRMCQDYASHYYVAAAPAFRKRSADGGRVAKDLARWQADFNRKWREVRFGHCESRPQGGQTKFRVQVFLGALQPEEVRVDLYANGVNGGAPYEQTMHRTQNGGAGDFWFEAVAPASRPASDFTPRIVAANPALLLPGEETAILWRS